MNQEHALFRGSCRGLHLTAVWIWTLALLVGCAGRSQPKTPAAVAAGEQPTAAAPQQEPADAADTGQEEVAAATGEEAGEVAGEEASQEAGEEAAPDSDEEGKATQEEKRSLRTICKQPTNGEEEPFLDKSRRRLQQTFCGATLWFDGLLGGEPDVDNARAVSGRLELSTFYSEHEGFEPKVRLRLNYDLPTLERRLNVFLGLDDEDDFVQDRQEGAAIRSTVFDIETDDQWLAGLGYRPPGKWRNRLDFKVGGKLRSAPEVFVQGRWRRNYFVGEKAVWRLRETVFWQNRIGFGQTTSIEVDHVLSPKLLARWHAIGTYAQESEGLEWRSSNILYRNLRSGSAIASELFIEGKTKREAPLREYGVRGVYRKPLKKRWFFGEAIVGYSWPRENLEEEREGSALVGISVELLFGRDPY